jgi:hypothetical protein
MRQPRLRYKDMTPEQQAFQRARTAEYRRRNLGKCRSYSRSYYLANREELKKNSIRRRSFCITSGGSQRTRSTAIRSCSPAGFVGWTPTRGRCARWPMASVRSI